MENINQPKNSIDNIEFNQAEPPSTNTLPIAIPPDEIAFKTPFSLENIADVMRKLRDYTPEIVKRTRDSIALGALLNRDPSEIFSMHDTYSGLLDENDFYGKSQEPDKLKLGWTYSQLGQAIQDASDQIGSEEIFKIGLKTKDIGDRISAAYVPKPEKVLEYQGLTKEDIQAGFGKILDTPDFVRDTFLGVTTGGWAWTVGGVAGALISLEEIARKSIMQGFNNKTVNDAVERGKMIQDKIQRYGWQPTNEDAKNTINTLNIVFEKMADASKDAASTIGDIAKYTKIPYLDTLAPWIEYVADFGIQIAMFKGIHEGSKFVKETIARKPIEIKIQEPEVEIPLEEIPKPEEKIGSISEVPEEKARRLRQPQDPRAKYINMVKELDKKKENIINALNIVQPEKITYRGKEYILKSPGDQFYYETQNKMVTADKFVDAFMHDNKAYYKLLNEAANKDASFLKEIPAEENIIKAEEPLPAEKVTPKEAAEKIIEYSKEGILPPEKLEKPIPESIFEEIKPQIINEGLSEILNKKSEITDADVVEMINKTITPEPDLYKTEPVKQIPLDKEILNFAKDEYRKPDIFKEIKTKTPEKILVNDDLLKQLGEEKVKVLVEEHSKSFSKAKGLTLKEMADKVGIDVDTLIERIRSTETKAQKINRIMEDINKKFGIDKAEIKKGRIKIKDDVIKSLRNEEKLADISKRREELKNIINAKLNAIKTGIPADALIDIAKYGATFLEEGIIKYGDWQKKMLEKLGENIKPYMRSLWTQAKAINTEEMTRKTPVEIRGLTKHVKEIIQALKSVYKEGEKIGVEKESKLSNERIQQLKSEHKERLQKAIEKESEKLKNVLDRAKQIRAVRDYFNLSDHDINKIAGKSPWLMSQWEFKQYLDKLRQRAVELQENKTLKNILMETIRSKHLKNEANYRKVQGYGNIANMTNTQLIEYIKALEQFQDGDVFLPERMMEKLPRTGLTIHTKREAIEWIAKQTNKTPEEIEAIKPSELDIYRTGISLSEKNPIFNLMVTEILQKRIEGEKVIQEVKNKAHSLAAASDKSRKDRGIVGRLIPQDKQIMEYMEADDNAKAELASKMTNEQLDFAQYMQQYFANALEYLIEIKELGEGLENYFTHSRMPFLETIKEEGVLKAFKNIYDNEKLREIPFNIYDGKTGKFVSMNKFFANTLHRSGVLNPSKNVYKVFMDYVEEFERMRSLNEILPRLKMIADIMTPETKTKLGLEMDTRIKDFMYKYINAEKGKAEWITKPGGRIDFILKALRTFTTWLDLVGSIPVSATVPIGETYATFQSLGVNKMALATKRLLTNEGRKIINKYESFVTESIWKQLSEPGIGTIDRLSKGIFGIFHEAARQSNIQFLLGLITENEFKTGEISSQRLAQIKMEIARVRYVPELKSIVGRTEPGKAITQYLTWAVPLLRTNVQNLLALRNVRTMTHKQWGELGRTVGIVTTALIIRSIAIDDKDDSFIGKMLRKSYSEALSTCQAMSPVLYFKSPRIMKFVYDLSNALIEIIRFEQYKTKPGLKGIADLERTLTPGALRQFVSKEEMQKSGQYLYKND